MGDTLSAAIPVRRDDGEARHLQERRRMNLPAEYARYHVRLAPPSSQLGSKVLELKNV